VQGFSPCLIMQLGVGRNAYRRRHAARTGEVFGEWEFLHSPTHEKMWS
jgi:hypothetical protein